MREVVKEIVTTKSQLNSLYLKSALTFTGVIDTEYNYKCILEWLTTCGVDVSKAEFRTISGKFMNEQYLLTGDNAYPEDLNLVSVINIETQPVIFERFAVGGRWFDDIVNNNARREYEAHQGDKNDSKI